MGTRADLVDLIQFVMDNAGLTVMPSEAHNGEWEIYDTCTDKEHSHFNDGQGFIATITYALSDYADNEIYHPLLDDDLMSDKLQDAFDFDTTTGCIEVSHWHDSDDEREFEFYDEHKELLKLYSEIDCHPERFNDNRLFVELYENSIPNIMNYKLHPNVPTEVGELATLIKACEVIVVPNGDGYSLRELDGNIQPQIFHTTKEVIDHLGIVDTLLKTANFAMDFHANGDVAKIASINKMIRATEELAGKGRNPEGLIGMASALDTITRCASTIELRQLAVFEQIVPEKATPDELFDHILGEVGFVLRKCTEGGYFLFDDKVNRYCPELADVVPNALLRDLDIVRNESSFEYSIIYKGDDKDYNADECRELMTYTSASDVIETIDMVITSSYLDDINEISQYTRFKSNVQSFDEAFEFEKHLKNCAEINADAAELLDELSADFNEMRFIASPEINKVNLDEVYKVQRGIYSVQETVKPKTKTDAERDCF